MKKRLKVILSIILIIIFVLFVLYKVDSTNKRKEKIISMTQDFSRSY